MDIESYCSRSGRWSPKSEGTDGRCSAGATFCQGVFGVGLVLCGVVSVSVDRVLNKRVWKLKDGRGGNISFIPGLFCYNVILAVRKSALVTLAYEGVLTLLAHWKNCALNLPGIWCVCVAQGKPGIVDWIRLMQKFWSRGSSSDVDLSKRQENTNPDDAEDGHKRSWEAPCLFMAGWCHVPGKDYDRHESAMRQTHRKCIQIQRALELVAPSTYPILALHGTGMWQKQPLVLWLWHKL